MPPLPPLDTGFSLTTARSRSINFEPDVTSPSNGTTIYAKTPIIGTSAFPKTPISAFPKTPAGDFPNPRLLGRRATTRSFDTGVIDQTEALAYGSEDDVLTKTGSFLYKIHKASLVTRYTLYVLPVAILLAIPVVITANPPYDAKRADGIRLLGLFIWIELAWLTIWTSRLVAKALPIMFQSICSIISTGIRKYSLVLKALEPPVTILLWSILCFSSTNIIFIFDKDAHEKQHRGEWIDKLKHVFMAGSIAAAIFVVEKTVISLISINYYRKQYARKIRESKRLIRLLDLLYETSRRLFPEFSKDFEREDTEIHRGTALISRRSTMDGKSIGIGSKVLDNVQRAREKATAALGALTNDATNQELGITPKAHSVVSKALENERSSKALARRLWLSLCSSGKDAVYKQDILEVLGPDREAEAEEIFNILDRDGNGDVSLDEMTAIVVNCGDQRKDRASSIQDISSAIAVLDKILSTIVVIGIAFLYAMFFSKTFATHTGQIWTSVASLAFSIGGTVTEFFACCIFLFVKHPYDVGDRVDIEKQELIVKHISLMFSVFKRVDNDSVVQIPHNIANKLWISNITRSKAMKERITTKVSFNTTMDEILALRKEMEKFVTAPENRHDFQPDFDIELTSVEDLFALALRVELRHKSNWSNEALRLHRRNKFMCELLSAFRRIPIERPLGNYGPANPTYTCELTNDEATECQRVKKEDKERVRLYPPTSSTPVSELLPQAADGGRLSPAQVMYPGLKMRTPGSAEGSAGRRPSIWSPL